MSFLKSSLQTKILVQNETEPSDVSDSGGYEPVQIFEEPGALEFSEKIQAFKELMK